jgi:hypothetical protein
LTDAGRFFLEHGKTPSGMDCKMVAGNGRIDVPAWRVVPGSV